MGKLALLLLLDIVICVYGRLSEGFLSATDVWHKTLPSVKIPVALAKAALSVEPAALSDYVSQLSTGHLVSPGGFCTAAKLACVPTAQSRRCFEIRLIYTYKFCPMTSRAGKLRAFFHEKDLIKGGSIEVPALKDKTLPRALLPKSLAEALPAVSEKQIPQMLQLLAIPFNSSLAEAMRETAGICDEGSGTCASSLEDLVSLATGYAGIMYQADDAGPFVNAEVVKVSAVPVGGEEMLACHPLMYPFQVIFCHTFKTQDTKLYKVETQGTTLVAVCHRDTNGWSPKHGAFQDLNSSPGKTDACHLLPQNHMVWY